MLGALAVVGVFAIAGFWWFDGYTLVQQRYWQGIALNRPFQYWSWANLASVVCAIGLGSVAGIGRVFDIAAIKRRSGLHLLVLAALAAILFADLSMLSKAETERIWLPFEVWLTAAGALLPVRAQRWWLSLNVIGAVAAQPPHPDELVAPGRRPDRAARHPTPRPARSRNRPRSRGPAR